jgi:hypothetical protein
MVVRLYLRLNTLYFLSPLTISLTLSPPSTLLRTHSFSHHYLCILPHSPPFTTLLLPLVPQVVFLDPLVGEFSYDIVTDVDLPKTSETLEFSSELEEGSSVKKSLKGERLWTADSDSDYDWNC